MSLLFLVVPQQTFAKEYFVAVSGSDSSDGSQAKPWRNIQKALGKVSSGDIITVQPGNYIESLTVAGSNLTIRANGKVTTKGWSVTGNGNTVKGFDASDPANNAVMRTYGNDNLIEGNEIHDTLQDGVWFFGKRNTFRKNHIYNIKQRAEDPHIDCFQTWGPAEDIIFEQNNCHNLNKQGSNQLVMVENQGTAAIKNLTFRNNIFIMDDPGYSPINIDRKEGQNTISGIYVYNNVFYNTAGGQNAVRLTGVDTARIQNNLIIGYGLLPSSSPYFGVVDGSHASTDIVVSHNAIVKNPGTQLRTTSYPNDLLDVDPKIVSLANLDFHLQPTSPLIDKGVSLAGKVTNDYAGNARPVGSGYDIGVYEVAGSVVPTATQTIAPTKAPTSTPVKVPTSTVGPTTVLSTTPSSDVCRADINRNGKVDLADYSFLVADFLNPNFHPESDINQDGVVDLTDYSILVANFLKAC
ncbi:MAG: choice-of-anchor Q domain-containing protein [Patescibacteria group bacterium]